MSVAVLNINADAIVRHTARIERINKTALPVAVHRSLSRAAFDVKTNTMPKEAKRFVQRAPTFFKSQSRVEPAKGYNIATMQATVGFIPGAKDKESGGATKDLAQQEEGGTIAHRAFIPTKQARAGKNYRRKVQEKNRLAAINKSKITDTKNSNAISDKAKFFSSAWHAGKGGYLISNILTQKGNKVLLRINSLKRKGRNTIVNTTPLYAVKKGRRVTVKQTRFMQKASNESGAKIEKFYEEEAIKQLKRVGK